MISLKGKVVVITGASSGIGEATALAFAKEGCSVVLAARRIERLELLREKILALGVSCLALQIDVSSFQDVQKLFTVVEREFSSVDILVNNAGVGRNISLLDTSLHDWKTIMQTNVDGVFYCTQEAVQRMLDSHVRGHIITVSSVLGLFTLPYRSAYCASKHAVTGFKRALRPELKRYGIRVSLIHPAGVDTEIVKDLGVQRKKWSMLHSSHLAEYIVAVASQDQLRIGRIALLNFFRRVYSFLRYFPK